MRRLLSILLWSVIAAAFIGPGTITTCAAAGAAHGYTLLWALLFSTLGCLVLQEAAARVTIVSGLSLAQALSQRAGRPWVRRLTLLLVLGAIVVGCAAYEAGNILGAVAGASLGSGLSRVSLTLMTGGAAVLLLWSGRVDTVARLMGIVVALMGAGFLATAFGLGPSPAALAKGALVPGVPAGSGLLIIGLVGTTIVPYNLFLGSALARGCRIGDVRLGLTVAILLGGAISMSVLVVGGAVEGAFDLSRLAATLGSTLGDWALWLFAGGLFCAGFSSAVTAPLAAAVTARGLFERDGGARWSERAWRYRVIWIVVLVTGILFGLSRVRPVAVILTAQALNGLLLPVAAGFLLLVVNDRGVMGDRVNPAWANLAMAGTFLIALLIGVSNVLRAGASALGLEAPGEDLLGLGAALLAAALSLPLFLAARRLRRGQV